MGTTVSQKRDSRREATGRFSLCGKYVIAGKLYRGNLPAAYAAVLLFHPMKAKLLWGGKGGFQLSFNFSKRK
jgi:hypothetical protein